MAIKVSGNISQLVYIYQFKDLNPITIMHKDKVFLDNSKAI